MTTTAIAGNSRIAESAQPERGDIASSTLVMSIGFPAHAFCADQSAIASLPLSAIDDDCVRLFDTAHTGLDDGQALIAVYPSFDASVGSRASARLRSLRLALGTHRLVPLACDLSPLAAAVFVSILSAASRYVPDPGTLIGCVPFLRRKVFAYAWFATLRNVVRPRARTTLRIQSVLGRGPFATALWPRPGIWPLSRPWSIERPHAGPVALAISTHDGDPTWTTTDLVEALGPEAVTTHGPTPLGPQWWGTHNLVEAVAFPTDIPSLVSRATTGMARHPCRWCRAEIVTEVCPLCAMADASAVVDADAAHPVEVGSCP